jgi:hypothetical protein
MQRAVPNFWLNWLISFGFAAALGCGPDTPAPPRQPCTGVLPGDVVITEFMADPAGSDTGRQYIELYNAADHTINLGGLSLFQSMADGSRPNAAVLPSVSVPTHGYYVLGDAGEDTEARPAYVSYGYGSDLGALRHENGKIGLRCATTMISEVTYSQVSAGRAREFDGTKGPTAAEVLTPTNWCDATEPLDTLVPSGENYGSPGAPNLPCASIQGDPAAGDAGLGSNASGNRNPLTELDAGGPIDGCFDAASGLRRPAKRAGQGQLVITEVMPAPSTNNNGAGEWFEIMATQDVDLNEVVLGNEGSGNTRLTSDACLSVKAGDWLLFARSSDVLQNGGLPIAAGTFDFTLADSASTTHPERALSLWHDGTLIDQFVWEKSTKGVALQRSATSLDSGTSAEWCVAEGHVTFGAGDRGTPGAPNLACSTQAVDAGGALTQSASGGASSSFTNTGGTVATWTTAPSSIPHATGGAGGTSSRLGTGAAPSNLGSGGMPDAPNDTGAGGTSISAADTGQGGMPFDGGIAQQPQGGTGSSLLADASTADQCTDVTGTERAMKTPRIGDLVITEVMAAPSTNNNGGAEWFEVLVNADLDLNGIEFSNEGSGKLLLSSDTCISAHAGERLVFARSAEFEQNGGLPFVTGTFGFTLADSASNSHPERLLALRQGELELSRVAWTKSSKGSSWQRAESSAATPDGDILEPDASTGTLDLWCVTPAASTFGSGDRGTPGSANQSCQ